MLRRVLLNRTQELISAIEEDGGVIVAGFASQSQVDQVNQDMHEVLENRVKDEAWKQRYQGRVIHGYLYGLSSTAREQWILCPQLQSVVNHFLRTSNPSEVDLNSATGRSTNAILSQAVSIVSLEGAAAQPMHRDDSIWQKSHQSQEESGYHLGSDIGVSLLVPGVDTTRANGATMFVPGSHLWADARTATPDEIVSVEMQRGDAFLFLASAIHCGGANTSPAMRIMHAIFFCRYWVRPEANDFVWYSRQEVETWSTEAQILAGYITDRILGICDDENPIYALRRREAEKKEAGPR